nr:MAG TPA: hypothetical protein [Caudoviricetes sp.]
MMNNNWLVTESLGNALYPGFCVYWLIKKG